MNQRIPEASLLVVFGASGDLAKRKLIPALYRLYCLGLLPPGFTLLGFARTKYTDEEFRQLAMEGIRAYTDEVPQPDEWNAFAQMLFYMSGDYAEEESYVRMSRRIAELDAARPTGGNRLFYLSTPPSVFKPITSLISKVGLDQTAPKAWSRLIIEKPFGHDLASARQLNEHVLQHFSEEQIYRIDHYLGKETVQNMLVFRFGNGIFEPIWNRNYVDHVQITVAESIGIGSRGGYYDRSGALRDMLQNHLMQLVALTAMEPPVAFDAKAVRDQKVNVLRSIRPLDMNGVQESVVRAQYASGRSTGKPVDAYLETEGVASDSTTDTFVAWKLEIDNWRWQGVPFYLRTGKALAAKLTEVNIIFRQPPLMFFEDLDKQFRIQRNFLSMRIQPDEGIHLGFDAKRPGPIVDVEPVNMSFHYKTGFGERTADAYERLLLDALLGDNTLFIRRDETEVAWDRVTRVLDSWRRQEEESRNRGDVFRLPTYAPGTWGPQEADELLVRDGRHWLNP